MSGFFGDRPKPASIVERWREGGVRASNPSTLAATVDAVVHETPLAVIDRMRFEASTAALTGLLAGTPSTVRATSNFDHYATLSVRYADALLNALNRSTAEAMTHERSR